MSNKDIIKVKWTEKGRVSYWGDRGADPLPTMMGEGSVEVGRWTEVKLPTSKVVCLEVPKSATQSVIAGGVWKYI
jgi:hypothetical protein